MAAVLIFIGKVSLLSMYTEQRFADLFDCSVGGDGRDHSLLGSKEIPKKRRTCLHYSPPGFSRTPKRLRGT